MAYHVNEVESFGKVLIKLSRKYKSTPDVVESFFEDLEKGNLVGDPIPGLKLKGNKVFKTRLENPDANAGKTGGFRIIWYLVTSDNEIYPLTIYSKNDQEDVPRKEIQRLVRKVIG